MWFVARFGLALSLPLWAVKGSPAENAENQQTLCCSSVAQVLQGKVFFPGSAEFLRFKQSYWTARAQEVLPGCFVKPTSAQDVSAIIRALGQPRFQSMDSCKFSIKGGGHLTWAGAASIPNGIVIDMSGMKEINIASDKSVVSVGAGNLWGDIFTKIEPQGLAVAGGRWSNVGTGLLLGGGLSFFQGQKGPACDGVINHEVVLANGSIVNANNTVNADLHKALKGGNNNFGVVTRFDLKAWPQGKIWGGSIMAMLPKERAMRWFENFSNSSHADPKSMIMFSTVTIFGRTFAGGLATYADPNPRPEVFHELIDHEINETSIWSLFAPAPSGTNASTPANTTPFAGGQAPPPSPDPSPGPGAPASNPWAWPFVFGPGPVQSPVRSFPTVLPRFSRITVDDDDADDDKGRPQRKRQAPAAASPSPSPTQSDPVSSFLNGVWQWFGQTVTPAGQAGTPGSGVNGSALPNLTSIIPGWGIPIDPSLNFTEMLRPTGVRSYKDIALMNGLFTPAGSRSLFASFSFHNSAAYMSALVDLHDQWQRQLPFLSGSGMIFQPLWKHSRAASYAAAGGNALGLEDVKEDVIIVLVLVAWLGPFDDRAVQMWTKQFIEAAWSKAKQFGVYSPYIYANYAAEFQDVIGGYGNKSREFLIRTANKYDPEGMFQRRVPGGYKLVRTEQDYCQFGC